MATVEVPDEVLRTWVETLSAARPLLEPPMAEELDAIVTVLAAGEQDRTDAHADESSPAPTDHLNGQLPRPAARAANELSGVAAAVTDSVTPAMVERLAALLTGFGATADRLTSPEAAALVEAVVDEAGSLTPLLHQLSAWQANGTWTLLEEALYLGRSLRDSVSPALVERAVDPLVNAVASLNQLLSAGALESAVRLTETVHESLEHAREDPRHITALGLVREIQAPDIQLGIKTMLELLRRLSYVVEG